MNKKTVPAVYRWSRLASVLVCAAAWLCLASPVVGRDFWVYIGTYTGAKSQGIYLSRMDDGGTLTPPELATASTNPAFLAVDGRDRFLYAGNEVGQFAGKSSGAVSAFSLDAHTGALTPLNQQPSGGAGPCHVAVDATGRVLLAANYDGGSVSAFPIKSDGSLGDATSFFQHRGFSVNRQRQSSPHAHFILPSPDNHFAFVCDLGLDQVLRYKLDASHATLTPADPPFVTIKAGGGPRHFAFHPNRKLVYVLQEMGCAITAFQYDAGQGMFSEIQTIPALPADQAVKPSFTSAEIAVHPSGKFLYASVRGPDVISVFSIDGKTGMLTLVDTVASGGQTPRNFCIDPSGQFLLAANQNSDSIVAFRIDAKTGRLSPTGQQLDVGKPVCVVFVPVR
jgi:6-phosphogluconolactonase